MRNRRCTAGAAAVSSAAREQSQRSSELPGQVSVTTISKPRGNLPVGTNLAVVVGSNLHFLPLFFFFFFFFLWVREAALPSVS